MIGELAQGLGGLGLFLLGMVLLTGGLRGLAGPSFVAGLRRFTRSPLSGVATGCAATALVQSSSATTVGAVGLAGAGLVSFPQALGIVFGANLGTTVTGWMVALLGFKLKLGVAAAPLVLVGVLWRLAGRGRGVHAGEALAGFGLVFLGIGGLQAATVGLEGVVTPERFPAGGLLGTLQLVGIGVAMTLVTQSSSAGVATAIAAVAAGMVSFGQAAAMVIGMDVGTTVTAALATVGGSVAARRTGWAHVIYNLFTACGALLLLPLYVAALEAVAPGATTAEPELALVGFHTSFNALGVGAVLPFTASFARLIERVVPRRPPSLAEKLDRRLVREPELALRTAGETLAEIGALVLGDLARVVRSGDPEDAARSRRVAPAALVETQAFLARLPVAADGEGRAVVLERAAAALHVVDQLRRLVDRLGQHERAPVLATDPQLRESAGALAAALEDARPQLPDEAPLADLAGGLAGRRAAYRHEVMARALAGGLPADDALARMDAWRWLERTTHHAWRAVHHLARLQAETPPPELPEPPEPA